jgi:predicted PurR-regulated permease PerM
MLSALLALFAMIGWILIPAVVDQVQNLIRTGPELMDRARGASWYQEIDRVFDLDSLVGEAVDSLREHPAEVAQHAFSVAGFLVAATAGFITILFVAAFMLIYGGGLVHWTIDQALPARRGRYRRAVERVYMALGGYIAGVSGVIAVNAITTVAFLAIIGVPFFLPLGVLSGLASLIPVLGVTITGALISVFAAVTQGIWLGVAVAIYITVYQQFENHVLAPLVYKHTVAINPLLSILMVLFLGELGGIIGAILAVPTLAVLKILVSEMLLLRAEQRPEVIPRPDPLPQGDRTSGPA